MSLINAALFYVLKKNNYICINNRGRSRLNYNIFTVNKLGEFLTRFYPN
jgi:hypothetical protein